MTYLWAAVLALQGPAKSADQAIAQLRQIGLTRLDEALTPVYEAVVAIAQLGAMFSTTSNSAVVVGAGERTFVVAAPDRQRFAAAAYIGVRATGDSGTALFGSLVDYNRTSGALTLNVTQFAGAEGATVASWSISAAAAPNLGNTAHSVGAYTQAETDNAITAAVALLRGGVGAGRDTLAEIGAALDALNLQISAITSGADPLLDTFAEVAAKLASEDGAISAINAALANRLRTDAAQSLTAEQISRTLGSLGFSPFVRGLLDDADDATARETLGAQAALGYTPVRQGGGAGQLGNPLSLGWDGARLKAQVDSTDLGALWTDHAGFFSQSGNGYQILPSGLIVQWGQVVDNVPDYYATFNISFPSACWQVVACPSGNPGLSAAYIAHVDGWNRNGFSARMRRAASGVTAVGNIPVHWLAVGV